MSKYSQTKLLSFLIFVIAFTGCNAALNMTPYLFISESTLDFSNVVVNSTKTLDLEIQNHDTQSLTVGEFQLVDYSSNANGDEFEIVEILDDQEQQIVDITQIQIDEFSKITMRISFTPAITEKLEAKLSFTHNDGKLDSPIAVDLTGTGVLSVLKFNPESVDFGNTIVGLTKTVNVKIENMSTNDVQITHFDFDPYSSVFWIKSVKNSQSEDLPGNEHIILTPGDYIELEISFEPVEVKDSEIDFLITFFENSEEFQTSTTIKGTVIANEPPEIVKIETAPVRIGEEARITVTVHDENGLSNLNDASIAIDFTPVEFAVMDSNWKNIGNDEFTISGTVVIPNIPSYYGYRTISVHVTDNLLASDTDYAFQMIYTGSLIEVGSGKPFTTIKPAVAAAVDGDCVLVHDGVYSSNSNTTEENRDISLDGKKIIVTSATGLENTTIQIDGAAGVFHRAFLCLNGETLDTIIHGFTIKGGFMRHEYGGGAVVSVNSAVSILSCIFKENVGTCDSNGFAFGGVISAINSKLVVRKTHFMNNSSFV